MAKTINSSKSNNKINEYMNKTKLSFLSKSIFYHRVISNIIIYIYIIM